MRIERTDGAVAFVLFRVVVDGCPDSIRSCESGRAAAKILTLDILHRLFHVKARVIRPGWNVEQSRLRAIRRVVPVRPALIARQYQRALSCGHHTGHSLRTSL